MAFSREFREQSCEWFYGHLQQRFEHFGAAKVVKSVGYNSTFPQKITLKIHKDFFAFISKFQTSYLRSTPQLPTFGTTSSGWLSPWWATD